jgi:hypothetical protein
MPSSFMPPSELEYYAYPQMLPNSVLGNSAQPAQHLFPQPLATMTQPSPNMARQGQKRYFSDMEYVDKSMPVQQHRDPAFYGLSASLPMSTYATPLSPSPQMANKRLKQPAPNSPVSLTPMQRPLQASASARTFHTNRPGASTRPRTVYSSRTMPSRRGLDPNGFNQSRHPQQRPIPNTPMGSSPNELSQQRLFQQRPTDTNLMAPSPSANPYMSDRPPSWNWINELHDSGTPICVLGSHDNNYAFTWPVLTDEPQTVNHLQSVEQGPRQMRQTLTQSAVQNSAMNTAVSYLTPDPSRAYHRFQTIPKNGIYSLGSIGAQFEDSEPTDSSFGLQGADISREGQGKPRPRLEEMQQTDMYKGSTIVAERSRPDLPHLPAFGASSLENVTNFDHDFEFDFDTNWDIGGDCRMPSSIKEPAREADQQTLTQNFHDASVVNSSDESALAILLQPVASYLSSSSHAPRQNGADDLSSNVMSVSDGFDLLHAHHETSTPAGNSSLSSTTEAKSTGDLNSIENEATSNVLDEHVPTNGSVQESMRSESATSNTSPSTTSPIDSSTSMSIQTDVPTRPRVPSTTSGYGLDECTLQTASTTSETSPSKTPSINNSTSPSVDSTVRINPSLSSSPEDRDAVGSSQYLSPGALRGAQSGTSRTEITPDVRHDIQELLDAPYPWDFGQPVAVKTKVLPLSEGRAHGRQIVWANGRSQVDAGQPKPMTSSEEEELHLIRRRREVPQRWQTGGILALWMEHR